MMIHLALVLCLEAELDLIPMEALLYLERITDKLRSLHVALT